MDIILTPDAAQMGKYVAQHAAADLRAAIKEYGQANLVVATGASQFEVLSRLVEQSDIDWSLVHGFHLDEYIGLSDQHPASFCRYLRERFVDQVPLASFEYLRGDADPAETIARAGKLISDTRIDLALVGIGENGHLAFNDPPADFETNQPYLIVDLDMPCREQQVGEGWFATLQDVPTQAISMSVNQILKANKIYCSVPDERKSDAVRATVEAEISPTIPASILRRHHSVSLVIDQAAASKLSADSLVKVERVA
ncbi:glucosamine-6-phosphate deaminase [Stieleria varia]|uniref:Glucosamine-6-phosphate deaminase 1 n=1 Tax=Stieleria varia TaxID=2528005 RepID=A0A5C6A5M8_9BACT|nr:glucosamine-6-phosphate deaminase [Stieleria varia]TWT94627.1 Glucosamine-6-phosphate deaminase 1 [Stieleria varia]